MNDIDLDAIEARARSVVSGNKWMTKITDEDVPALVARVRELEDAIARVKDECHKTGEYNAHAKHLNIRSARLLAVEVLHILSNVRPVASHDMGGEQA